MQDMRVAQRKAGPMQNNNENRMGNMRHPLFHAWPNPLPPTSTQPLGYPTIFGLAITGAALSAAIGANPPGPGKHVSECQGYLIPMSVPIITVYCTHLELLATLTIAQSRCRFATSSVLMITMQQGCRATPYPQINSADHH